MHEGPFAGVAEVEGYSAGDRWPHQQEGIHIELYVGHRDQRELPTVVVTG